VLSTPYTDVLFFLAGMHTHKVSCGNSKQYFCRGVQKTALQNDQQKRFKERLNYFFDASSNKKTVNKSLQGLR